MSGRLARSPPPTTTTTTTPTAALTLPALLKFPNKTCAINPAPAHHEDMYWSSPKLDGVILAIRIESFGIFCFDPLHVERPLLAYSTEYEMDVIFAFGLECDSGHVSLCKRLDWEKGW